MVGEKVGSQFEVYNLRALDVTWRMPWTQEPRNSRKCGTHVTTSAQNEKGAASPRGTEESSRLREHRGSIPFDSDILSLHQPIS